MSVSRRRTASVVISGSSNLPTDKLNSLSSSINTILQLIVELYNACEDANTPIQQKFNKIADAHTMDTAIDQLIHCLGEEMNICSVAVRNTMIPKYNEVSNNGRHLKSLLNQYNEQSPSRFQIAKSIFESMLQLVNDAIELLKLADKHFVELLINNANLTLENLKNVRDAVNMGDLVVATQDYVTSSVKLAKKLNKRIESGVLLQDQKHTASQALDILRNESANVVNVKRNQLSFPGNEMHSSDLESNVKTVVAAVKIVLDVAHSDPIFGVDFQVDVVDDEFGLLLTKLVDSVDQCNQPQMVTVLGQVIREVSNRAVNSGLTQDDSKVKKVRGDLAVVRDASQHALQFKQNAVSNQLIIEASTKLDSALKQLRESYHALVDNQPVDRTSLRQAAQKIIASLNKLV